MTYVIAVSGGVDSVCLLDMLANKHIKGFKQASFVVAHVDHGMREESASDREFVQKLCQKYKVHFEYLEAHLGKGASEDTARQARYQFFERVREAHGAAGIVTAHHADDRLETAIINILRGTGPRGLFSLRSTSSVLRPLLKMTKQDLIEYAYQHQLEWREDVTNESVDYLRNYIRHTVISKLGSAKDELISLIDKTQDIYDELDALLPDYDSLTDYQLRMLPFNVLCEVIAIKLRQLKISDYTNKTINRLAVFMRTAQQNQKTDVDKNWWLVKTKSGTIFEHKQH